MIDVLAAPLIPAEKPAKNPDRLACVAVSGKAGGLSGVMRLLESAKRGCIGVVATDRMRERIFRDHRDAPGPPHRDLAAQAVAEGVVGHDEAIGLAAGVVGRRNMRVMVVEALQARDDLRPDPLALQQRADLGDPRLWNARHQRAIGRNRRLRAHHRRPARKGVHHLGRALREADTAVFQRQIVIGGHVADGDAARKRHRIDLACGNARAFQHGRHRLQRRADRLLHPRQALFVDRGDQPSVAQHDRAGIVRRRHAENNAGESGGIHRDPVRLDRSGLSTVPCQIAKTTPCKVECLGLDSTSGCCFRWTEDTDPRGRPWTVIDKKERRTIGPAPS